MILRGYHQGLSGEYEAGEQAIAEGYQQHVLRNGGLLFHGFQAWKRGEVLLLGGRAEACLELVDVALDLAQDHQERAYLCELMLLRGRALLALGDDREAEATLRVALSTALTLGVVPARLHAALELARLLERSERGAQVQSILMRALRGLDPQLDYPPASNVRSWLARLSS